MKPIWTEAFKDRPTIELADFLVLALLFFALPFIVIYSAHDGFITPKWCALAVGLFAVGGIHFWRATQGREFIVPLHPVNGLILGWWLWKLIGISWASSFWLALEDFAQSTVLIALVFLSQSILYQERRRIVTLGVLLSFAGSLIALWVLALDFLRAFGDEPTRVMSRLSDWRDELAIAGFGNTGHISDFLVLSFLATLCGLFIVQGTKRVLFFCCLLWVQAAALIVCWSFHSIVSLVVASAVMGFLLLRRWQYAPRFKRRLPRLWIAAAGWILVVLFFVTDQPLNPHQSKLWKPRASAQTALPGIFGHAFSSARWQQGGVTRQAIWLTSAEMVKTHPLLGVGTGNFTYVYPTIETPALLNNPEIAQYAYMWTNAAHNIFLQQTSELGILGFLLLIGLIGTGGYFTYQRLSGESASNHMILSWAFCGLFALTLQGQMNFILELPASSLMFFLILSLCMVLPKRGVVVDLIMPVTRPFGPFEAGIMMKNMRLPTALVFMGTLTGAASIAFAVVLMLIAFGGSWFALKPTKASIEYKHLYEEMRFFNQTGALENPEASIARAEKILQLNPGHRDARANLIELLLLNPTAENSAKAVEQAEQLGNTLQDAKFLRLSALALTADGKPVDAGAYWTILEKRYPGSTPLSIGKRNQ
ncbi:MAG: O-antigen ligase family protein [Sumerlaeia bacterium]